MVATELGTLRKNRLKKHLLFRGFPIWAQIADRAVALVKSAAERIELGIPLSEASEMAAKIGKKHKRRSAEQTAVKVQPDILLMDAVVRVVAQKGIEGASTRAIAAEAGNGLTDTVIYRYFSGKEELLRRAFRRESAACEAEVESRLPVMGEMNLARDQRLRFLWHTLWTWTTAHKSSTVFLVRYYYSASFDQSLVAEFQEIMMPVARRVQEMAPGVETDRLLFIALQIMADSVYPVCCGRAPDSASASEYGFRRLLGLVNAFLPNQNE